MKAQMTATAVSAKHSADGLTAEGHRPLHDEEPAPAGETVCPVQAENANSKQATKGIADLRASVEGCCAPTVSGDETGDSQGHLATRVEQ